MTTSFATLHPRSLRAEMEVTTQQLLVRRARAAALVARLEGDIRAGMTSPGVLILAAGVGAALEQTSHSRGRSVLHLLNTLTGGSSLLLALGSSIGARMRRHSPE
ncbi:MAG: hypothetical protein RIE74_17665 [Pseudomonadales bacterium]